MPKSIAPKLIRFAHTSVMRIRIKAKSSESGITEAVIMPPRTLPSSSTNTKITMSAPSIRLRAMVPVVRLIRFERARKGFILMSFGNDFSMLFMRSFTAVTTLSELAPLSIKIMPPTASRPSWVKAP